MKLYGYWRSTSSWRVRVALHLKGIAFENHPTHLRKGEQQTPEHRARNAMGQVPVLEVETDHRPRRLTQSMAIIEYLDERYPAPPLLPRDLWARAEVRRIAEIVNSGIQPLQNYSVLMKVQNELGGDRMAWGRAFNERGLAALEAVVASTAGRFAVGDAVTLADVAIVPQLYGARRFGVDVETFPRLARVEASCAALPAFRAAHPDAQPDYEAGAS